MEKNKEVNSNDDFLTNEEIFLKANSIYGLQNGGKKLEEYSIFLNQIKEHKIDFGNMNILIQSESSYDSYEELLNLIIKLFVNEKVINNESDILNTELRIRESSRSNRKEDNEINNAKVIISDISSASMTNVKDFIKKFEDKIFILTQQINPNGFRRYDAIETRQDLSKYFYWNFKIGIIKEEEKKSFVETTFSNNKIKVDKRCKLIEKLSNLQFYKVKEELLRIIVKCKLNNITTINNKNLETICNIDDLKLDEIENYKDENKNDIDKNKEKTKKEKIISGRQELNSLIGLYDVKNQIEQIVNFVKVKKNNKRMPMLHMVFEGNPGTGKTSIARIIGKIFAENKILSDKNKFVEVDREKLVGRYVGWTAGKTKEAIEKAKGGVLFVDEAYSLANDDSHRDFGYEAIDTLIKEMEDNRDNLCVILAGYTKEMEELLKTNPGFESRIQFKVKFPDYTEEELYDVFKKYCKEEGYQISSNIKDIIINYFNEEKRKEKYSNARCARSLFEKVEFEQADRIIKNKDINNTKIIKEDILKAIEKNNKSSIQKKCKIGF